MNLDRKINVCSSIYIEYRKRQRERDFSSGTFNFSSIEETTF